MEVVICNSASGASELAARGIAACIRTQKTTVLGLATGATPTLLYRELVGLYERRGLSFRTVRFFALDEYVGLSAEHPASYSTYVREHLTGKVDVPVEQVDVLRGDVVDLATEASRYESAILAAGGIDIQILGIGTDGHIGFNEPSSSLRSRTRIKTLSPRTVEDNRRHFPKGYGVPEHVITMGIATILDAKRIYLLAFGESKAEIIARTVEGPITAMVPASVLQMHEKVTVFVDEAAASKLSLKDYYKRVWELKPEWQR